MLQVLFIDGSGTDVDVFCRWLTKMGINRVVRASSAEEGIYLAKQRLPDLIITDIDLPGMSGFQAIRQLKADIQLKDIPVMIFSRKIDEVNTTWGLRQGAFCCIRKPLSEKMFQSQIQSMLSHQNESSHFALQGRRH